MNEKKYLLTVLIGCFITFFVYGQTENPANRYVDVYKQYLDATCPLEIDSIKIPLLHAFAKDFLKVKYMFWVNQEPYFSEDVIPCLSIDQITSLSTTLRETEIYKTIGGIKLKLYLYRPSERNALEQLPAVVFFHGGGWGGGHAWQFEPQCKYLAERGMVAMSVEYRVRKRQGATPFECVADAKSAIRWVRAHARELGIDENRIAAGGGSAGGHMAACTALIRDFDEINEDLGISSIPNVLILFNAVLDVPEILHVLPKEVIRVLKDRATEISPIHNLLRGAPPTIIFHGTADGNVPFHQAALFCEEMKKYGNRCEVVPYEGRGHGFFNYNKGTNPDFLSTMENTVKFLTSIGYIKRDTTIKK